MAVSFVVRVMVAVRDGGKVGGDGGVTCGGEGDEREMGAVCGTWRLQMCVGWARREGV